MSEQPARRAAPATRPPRWAVVTLWVMIAAYSVYFSALSIRLHEAHHTHAADLGQIDLAIWNTSQGRFVQEIKGDQVSTRLTDHVEPIFAPVSLVFWLWDDVRALLVLQSVVLALGAWPVFALAWQRLGDHQKQPAASLAETNRGLGLIALTFALAYLLYPPLQAANVAEFHALPLATPLILLAFLFATRRQWARFALAALLVATAQEGAALLTAALGIYALVLGLRQRLRQEHTAGAPAGRAALLAGLIVLIAGLVWFYAATFVIIPTYATQAYGLGETPYAARFGALGDSFGDVLRSLLTRPLLVLHVATEPLRIGYVLRLLAPVGFLALVAPDYLLLGLPLFLANALSSYPFQYSGQLHYSAPLAAYALMAAIVGSSRLRPLARRTVVALHRRRLWRAHRSYVLLGIWLLGWSIGCQIAFGYTPIGSHFRQGYVRPAVTDHHRLLARFAAQIPNDAALSTMPTLYPHLSHRQFIYQFPTVANAEYVLLDAAARSGWSSHPAVVRDQVEQMLRSGAWAVQDAQDGYVLLKRVDAGQAAASVGELPAAFYDFARPTAAPQFPLDITFDGRLKLLGYDLIEDSQWRRTGFRFYWQALAPLPTDTNLRVFVVTPSGDEVDSSEQRPLMQPLWYPPAAWPVGAVVITDKLPWPLPKQWAVGVGVYQGDTWDDVSQRWRIVDNTPASATPTLTFEDRTWVRLNAWEWQRGKLVSPPAAPQFRPANAVFGGDGWTVALTGVTALKRAAPGASVPLTLRWQSDAAAPRDYTVFIHVRDSNGRTVAQADATPHWYGPLPTSRWPTSPGSTSVLDAHRLQLPDDLPPGVYDIVVGWYYWETQERLALLDTDGRPVDDGAVVGQIEVDTTVGPTPDLVCALLPEACASQ